MRRPPSSETIPVCQGGQNHHAPLSQPGMSPTAHPNSTGPPSSMPSIMQALRGGGGHTKNALQSPAGSGVTELNSSLRTRKWIGVQVFALINLFTVASLSHLSIQSQSIHILERVESKDVNYLDVKMQCSRFNSSVSSMWNNIGDIIMKASHFPEEHASNKNFTNWVDTLFQTDYQAHQLRSSSMHQPDPVEMLRLLQIIHDRYVFLKGGKRETESSPPPLHIMAMGGSVTVGMGCGENHVGLNIPGWSSKQVRCAWPARLENMFNQVLFEGKKVVKVSNLAAGGASSEVGKVVMEYRLFSEEVKTLLPHVVIWAHAPNDSQEADKEAVEYMHLPAFVRASRNLRMCDEELPLVVMLDDFYGADKYTPVNDVSSMLYKVSSWYGLMGVSHSNVIKDKLYANFDNSSLVTGILGGTWNLHPGMGSHIGVAWTLFFNFLKAFTESCEDGPALRYGAVSKNNTNTTHKKYLGSYHKDETVKSLHSRWQQESDLMKRECDKQKGAPVSEVCTYAWMANPMTEISHPKHVKAKLEEVMVHNDGWEASGFPVRQPRTGWYAQKENATFTLELVPTLETKYITLMSMKSYGENFVDTELRLTLRVVQSNETKSEESQHAIYGYHETKTSIHIPHKFQLPGGGAKVGDTISVKAELVSGAYFKINGVALCTY